MGAGAAGADEAAVDQGGSEASDGVAEVAADDAESSSDEGPSAKLEAAASKTARPKATPPKAAPRRRPGALARKLRAWLRTLHRDVGYLAVGLTFVYALSGLAVNHISDWDPNFTQIEREHEVEIPKTDDDGAIAAAVLSELGIDAKPSDVYRPEDGQLEIAVDERTLFVDLNAGRVREEGQEARLFLRAANWLHLNRGKKAWTYVADGYAVFLLFLATSGLFMIPGRKGLLGRGAVLAGLGALVPIAYVVLSGP